MSAITRGHRFTGPELNIGQCYQGYPKYRGNTVDDLLRFLRELAGYLRFARVSVTTTVLLSCHTPFSSLGRHVKISSDNNTVPLDTRFHHAQAPLGPQRFI